jgi:hypothetical protein
LIEPPTPDRVTEIVRSALHQAEQALLTLIAERVGPAAVSRLEALIAVSDDEDEDVLGLIKAAPGNVSLDTMLAEISKLEAIRAIGLPADLFADVAPQILAGWRARALVESPSHLRQHPQPTKLALLGALLALRKPEVTDSLAQLLISTVHRINAHAEQKVHRGARQGLQARHGQGGVAPSSTRNPTLSVCRHSSAWRDEPGAHRRTRRPPPSAGNGPPRVNAREATVCICRRLRFGSTSCAGTLAGR